MIAPQTFSSSLIHIFLPQWLIPVWFIVTEQMGIFFSRWWQPILFSNSIVLRRKHAIMKGSYRNKKCAARLFTSNLFSLHMADMIWSLCSNRWRITWVIFLLCDTSIDSSLSVRWAESIGHHPCGENCPCFGRLLNADDTLDVASYLFLPNK